MEIVEARRVLPPAAVQHDRFAVARYVLEPLDRRLRLYDHPIVDKEQRLLAGHAVFADVLQQPLVDCTVVDCSDEWGSWLRTQEARLESEEKPRVVSDMLARLLQYSAEHRPDLTSAVGKYSPTAFARNTLAVLTGLTSGTIKVYASTGSRLAHHKTFNDFGIPQPAGFLEDVARRAVHMDECMRAMRSAKLALRGKYPEYARQLSMLIASGNLDRPVSLCPYCKHWGERMNPCKHCDGRGWVGQPVLDSAPEALLETEPLLVVDQHGHTVPLMAFKSDV